MVEEQAHDIGSPLNRSQMQRSAPEDCLSLATRTTGKQALHGIFPAAVRSMVQGRQTSLIAMIDISAETDEIIYPSGMAVGRRGQQFGISLILPESLIGPPLAYAVVVVCICVP